MLNNRTAIFFAETLFRLLLAISIGTPCPVRI
jgi:hypothetical protein